MGWMTFFIWLIIGVVCVFIELAGTDFVFLMLAGGTLGGAITGLFFPGNILAQVLAFGVVSVVLLLVLRPYLKTHLQQDLPSTPMNIDSVINKRCRVLSTVTAEDGLVDIVGAQWSARCNPDEMFTTGEYAYVDRVDGATVILRREAKLYQE